MRSRLSIVFMSTIAIAALLGGFLGSKVKAGSSDDATDTQKLLHTFAETLAVVQANYVREVESEKLVENAIRGMLRTLDPHSSFFTRPDYSRLQEEQQGKYYGLGITIRAEAPGSGRVVVVEPPSPGTPAYKAGIRAGDIISKVRGVDIGEWDINEEVIPNLKGPKGTTVDITIERPGENEPIDLTVERDEIPLFTIKFAFDVQPGIGYIKIDKFSETTGEELNHALDEIGESELTGLILDLRDNPGGALGAAIAVSDRFLDKGELIVSTKGRNSQSNSAYRTRRPTDHEYPMVVLVNSSSASASEIVAGALQDHGRALIVGETSFGKALVQTIFPIDGRRGLALTTGKYYTPNNRLIQRDYSDGFYNYYYSRNNSARAADGEAGKGEGGKDEGGIAPDHTVQPRPYTRLVRLIDRQNLFYKFSVALTTGEIRTDVRYDYPYEQTSELTQAERRELENKMLISDQTLARFKAYLDENKVESTDEQFDENQEVISTRIRRELFIKLFGEKDGYRETLRIDDQVQKAIELLPEAGKIRGERTRM